MKIYKLKITNKTANFNLRVTVLNSVYEIGLRWNTISSLWVLSLSDADGVIYQGIPLVAGIDYFHYVAFDKMPDASLFVNKTPDYDELGESVQLLVAE